MTEFKELKTELKQLNQNVAEIKTNFAVFLEKSNIFFAQNEKDHEELKDLGCSNRNRIGRMEGWKLKAQGALYIIALVLLPLLVEYLKKFFR
jgi:hypothetical protein